MGHCFHDLMDCRRFLRNRYLSAKLSITGRKEMKQWIWITVVAVVAIGSITAYFVFSGGLTGGILGQKRTVETAEVRIEFQRAYLFEEWTIDFEGNKVLKSKGLLIELRLENIGDRTKTFPEDSFYIRDSQGQFYKELQTFREWQYQYGLKQVGGGSYLELEPGESSNLKFYLLKEQLWLIERRFDFPEDMTGLKLIMKDRYTGEIQATMPLGIEKAPTEATGVEIEVQRAYMFEAWSENLYGKKIVVQRGLLMELKVESIRDTMTCVARGDFSIKDGWGKIHKFKNWNVFFQEWTYTVGGRKRVPSFGIGYLELEPRESSDLKLYLCKEAFDGLSGVLLYSSSDFPESLEGLTLVYEDVPGKTQADIPFEVETP